MKRGRPEILRRLNSSEFILELKAVDVILGIDEPTGNTFVLFGRSTIKAARAYGRSFDCTVLRVRILLETDELEALVAAVSAAKGYHEYEASETISWN